MHASITLPIHAMLCTKCTLPNHKAPYLLYKTPIYVLPNQGTHYPFQVNHPK